MNIKIVKEVFLRAGRTSGLVCAFAISTCLVQPAVAANKAKITKAEMLAVSCAGCHGTDGKSPGSIPPISGRSAAFIEEKLRGFRDDSHPSTVMGRHARGYTDDEIRLIANYFANIK